MSSIPVAPSRMARSRWCAPGTGLGEAFLVWSGSEYIACSSEGGHADFAPGNAQQAELWRYLSERFGHVAYERVCSGSGIPNIYDFLRDAGGGGARRRASPRALAGVADRTPLIVQAGMTDPIGNPLCAAALDIFVSVLGAEAGNMALKVMATGGVYLAGGMPPRVLERLGEGRFMRPFAGKGRLSELLEAIPVNVVIARAALIGAALYGLDRFREA